MDACPELWRPLIHLLFHGGCDVSADGRLPLWLMHHSFCASTFLPTSKHQLFPASLLHEGGWLPATDLANEATKQP